MKKRIAFAPAILFFLLFAYFGTTYAADSERQVTILFTHDLHSFFLPFRVAEAGGGSSEQGGYGRLASLIAKYRAHYGAGLLLVDGGDFSMGTLFHTLYEKEALELRLMGRMGYDVVTFGNHDFDFHTTGLASMLHSASTAKERLPEIVFSNAVFNLGPESEGLKRAFRNFPVKDYTIFERNGVRIGIFGILGKDAAGDMAFPSEMAFDDPIEAAKKMTDILKNKEKVNMIICLSHSGTSRISKYSEDENLAEQVPGIDVIISAHTHTVLSKPIVFGKVIIASAGCYGSYLGVLELVHSGAEGTRFINYSLQPVSSEVSEDRFISESVEGYKKMVEREYLSDYGYRFDQVVARSGFNFEDLASIYVRQGESGLGNLVVDAFRGAVEKAEGDRDDYVHVALEPIGTIRDSILKGDVTTADIFRILSLGVGEDRRPGYPLVSYYINGRELKSLLEVHTTLAPSKPTAAMQVSGIRFAYNPSGVPFERVTSVLVRDPDGVFRQADPKRLYRICANIYVTRRFLQIGKVTQGRIEIRPKDKTGRDITDLKNAVIYARAKNGRLLEVKEWTALAGFLASLPDKDSRGIPQIPEKYKAPEGRITIDASATTK